ncbi:MULTISPECIES: hypothetical protein [Cytobacillus]|uniref:Uncharacterized protein n=1 Tax=Cytobacillus oceanisediminis TaxID=665099 RepID=A0ABX3CMX9_9BACI|nr:hypothetical protein [Cytobacillus oceanisediminis]EFV75034.1 hypothetical protein HMPREF1013_04679 [Bacillus sp. 2_A_57_CT2]MCM3402985.1 hypothetical protein [Cytobacillus oceanisediminis]OHX44581.1 hypothetical protein BBV17_25495 [Cytobacillus oceanisediminis]
MDLVEIKINICLDTLSMDDYNLITGEIYFSVDNQYFPDEKWDDFIVVILAWWHKAILNLNYSRRNGIVQKFEFMDGPLFIRGTKISEDILEMEFINEKIDYEHILFTCQTSIIKFKKNLIKSTRQLLKELKNRNWQSDDIEELEKMCKILSE